jgi:hypothetical protein
MRLSITAGHTDHAGKDLPYMIVDGMGCLIDLAGVGNLWDPTVTSITWAPTVDTHEAGVIVLQTGIARRFTDRDLLEPYLRAFRLRLSALLADHERQVEIDKGE